MLKQLFKKAIDRNIIVFDKYADNKLSLRLIALCKTVYKRTYNGAKIKRIYIAPGNLPNKSIFYTDSVYRDNDYALGIEIIPYQIIMEFEYQFEINQDNIYLPTNKSRIILCEGNDDNAIIGAY